MWLSFPDAVERLPGEAMNGEPSIEPDPRSEGRGFDRHAAEEHLSMGTPRDTRRGSVAKQAVPTRTGRATLDESLVSITLSRHQVDHVVRASLGDDAAPNISGLVADTGFHRSRARKVLSSRYRALQDNRRLSRSLLAGLLVLSCFPPEGVDLGIKDISEQLELNTSTVHRYVLTLVAAGLLERDPDTRRYRLLPE